MLNSALKLYFCIHCPGSISSNSWVPISTPSTLWKLYFALNQKQRKLPTWSCNIIYLSSIIDNPSLILKIYKKSSCCWDSRSYCIRPFVKNINERVPWSRKRDIINKISKFRDGEFEGIKEVWGVGSCKIVFLGVYILFTYSDTFAVGYIV